MGLESPLGLAAASKSIPGAIPAAQVVIPALAGWGVTPNSNDSQLITDGCDEAAATPTVESD
jgi:hypothetical protein